MFDYHCYTTEFFFHVTLPGVLPMVAYTQKGSLFQASGI